MLVLSKEMRDQYMTCYCFSSRPYSSGQMPQAYIFVSLVDLLECCNFHVLFLPYPLRTACVLWYFCHSPFSSMKSFLFIKKRWLLYD